MRKSIARRLTVTVAAVALAGLTLAPVHAQLISMRASADARSERPQRETSVVNTTFVGTVFNYGDLRPRAIATTLRIRVESLTPDREAARLASILRVRGERTLENELAKRDVGFLQIDNRFPERLSAAFLTDVGGERHLVLILQRQISPREIWSSARSANYRFRVLELTLDASGHGAGEMLAAARFRIEKDGTLGTRNLGFIPWRVMNLHALES